MRSSHASSPTGSPTNTNRKVQFSSPPPPPPPKPEPEEDSLYDYVIEIDTVSGSGAGTTSIYEIEYEDNSTIASSHKQRPNDYNINTIDEEVPSSRPQKSTTGIKNNVQSVIDEKEAKRRRRRRFILMAFCCCCTLIFLIAGGIGALLFFAEDSLDFLPFVSKSEDNNNGGAPSGDFTFEPLATLSPALSPPTSSPTPQPVAPSPPSGGRPNVRPSPPTSPSPPTTGTGTFVPEAGVSTAAVKYLKWLNPHSHQRFPQHFLRPQYGHPRHLIRDPNLHRLQLMKSSTQHSIRRNHQHIFQHPFRLKGLPLRRNPPSRLQPVSLRPPP